MKSLCKWFGIVLSLGFAAALPALAGPTTGFHLIPDSYYVQKPYNLNASDRFTSSNGVYTCWVFGNDQPFSQGSTTGPRTEMRWNNFPQQTRENMFECDAMFD